MDRWHSYLFEAHSEATLRDWAGRLGLFRFFRAFGGHANDDDTLQVAFRYLSLEELRSFFGFLQIPLTVYSELPPQPQPGVAYTGEEYAKFPALIRGTTWVKQPGHCQIRGRVCLVRWPTDQNLPWFRLHCIRGGRDPGRSH